MLGLLYFMSLCRQKTGRERKMKKRGWKLKTAVLLAAAAIVITGCSAGKSQEATGTEGKEERTEQSAAGGTESKTEGTGAGKDSVIVVMGPSSEPEAGFDPAYGWGAGEHVHEPLIQSTLTVTTADLKIDYDLATDMSVSDDGLTWTVKIRDGVSFTDGEKLTAKDVAFTYNTLKSTSSVNDFTMLDSVQAVDDTTVVFHMKRAYSIWPYTMAIVGIVPEHAYRAVNGEHPSGTAP